MAEKLSTFDRSHILGGKSLIQGYGAADLEDNPELWRQLWELHRDDLLQGHYGFRPVAWYRFDDIWDDRQEDESEVDCLHRHDQIDDDEQQALWDWLVSKAKHNLEPNWLARRTGEASGCKWWGDSDQHYDEHDLLALENPPEDAEPEELSLVESVRDEIIAACGESVKSF